MNGQWMGNYTGTNAGLFVLDVDDAGTHYQAIGIGYDANIAYPRTFSTFDIPKGQTRFDLRIDIAPLERGSGNLLSPTEMAQKFPGVTTPSYADTKWSVSGDEIEIAWQTQIQTQGHGKLRKSEAGKPSKLGALPNVETWSDFKSFVLSLEAYRYTYRGQRDSTRRLRTSFHRTARSSLVKFGAQDVPALHRHLSGLTSHNFNANDPNDYASFLNLAQHHGYPTPLLDWTHSPFVAAYFAFRDLRRNMIGPDKKVRILLFDAKKWNLKKERARVLMPGYLHVTMLEPFAFDNSRAQPQQAISMVTNVDDIETYMGQVEQYDKLSYLQAIDLPTEEYRSAMQDLALMGITAGSLFPGLDGACLQLRERFFEL